MFGHLVTTPVFRSNPQSVGYAIRFKQLQVINVTYTDRDISYDYDKLQRLLLADYGGTQYSTAMIAPGTWSTRMVHSAPITLPTR